MTRKPGEEKPRTRRVTEDNVIHVNFGARRSAKASDPRPPTEKPQLATRTSIAKKAAALRQGDTIPEAPGEQGSGTQEERIGLTPAKEEPNRDARAGASESKETDTRAPGDGDDTDRSQASKSRKKRSTVVAESEGFFLDAIRANTDPARIKRGQRYAREGHVLNLTFGNGAISADVAGSQPMAFRTSLLLEYRSTDDLVAVETYLSDHPAAFKDIHAGKIPYPLEKILYAQSPNDIRVRCSCPDPQYYCKHAVAVAYALTDALATDSTKAFRLRGIELDELEQRVLARSKKQAMEKASLSQENFWEGTGLPELPNPRTAPVIDDSELPLLHKAMRLISYTSIDELRAVSDIEDMYEFLTRD